VGVKDRSTRCQAQVCVAAQPWLCSCMRQMRTECSCMQARAYDAGEAAAFHAAQGPPVSVSDELHALVYAQSAEPIVRPKFRSKLL